MRAVHILVVGLFAGAISSPDVAAQDAPETVAQPALALVLNIPAFRIDVFRDSTPIRSFGVAVGTRQFPTPRGEYAISQITWNPWWIPPPSEWAKNDTVTPPGPRNPMGQVKLLLAPYYFIHGTPLQHSIGSAASHGCVRMRNDDAVVLARLLQASSGTPMSDSVVAALLETRKTLTVALPIPLPVTIVYRTAETRSDTLLLYPDVYRLQPSRLNEALGTLAAAGLDSTAVDRERLDELLTAARTATVRIPLDSLRRRATARRDASALPRVIVKRARPLDVSDTYRGASYVWAFRVQHHAAWNSAGCSKGPS
jgi:hypothetical protein